MANVEFIIWILAILAAFVFHMRKAAREKARPSARVATPDELDPVQRTASDVDDIYELDDEEVRVRPEPVTAEWGRREPTPRPRQMQAPSPPVTNWRHADRLELAHAVVAMTVLGPCRALQPYGPEVSNPSAGGQTRPAPPAASRQP